MFTTDEEYKIYCAQIYIKQLHETIEKLQKEIRDKDYRLANPPHNIIVQEFK